MNTHTLSTKTGTSDQLCIKQEVAKYWSWRSFSYDRTSAQQRLWWDIYLSAADSSRQCRVLEVGTGTGFIASGFAHAGHRVTAIDIAPDMLIQAQSIASSRGLRIDFLLADAEKPPFISGSFDVIACRNLLWTLCNPEQALNNWYKLLRPDGRLIIADGVWQPRKPANLACRIKKTFKAVLHKKPDASMSRFEHAYRNIRETLPYFKGIEAKEAENILRKCGYVSLSRHEQLFVENPYLENSSHNFFIISAARRKVSTV